MVSYSRELDDCLIPTTFEKHGLFLGNGMRLYYVHKKIVIGTYYNNLFVRHVGGYKLERGIHCIKCSAVSSFVYTFGWRDRYS